MSGDTSNSNATDNSSSKASSHSSSKASSTATSIAARLIPLLSASEIDAIEHECAHLPDRESAAIDALRIVQGERGWVSDESVRGIAQLLGMSTEAVDAIATFYSLIHRRPVGRHVVRYCDSVSCYVMGYEAVRDALCATLGIAPGQTTADGRYTLLPTVCLGACDRAPALNIDRDLVFDVTPEGVAGVLARYE